MVDFVNHVALTVLTYGMVTRGGLAAAKGLTRLVRAFG
jgi:hypothetical protein